MYNILGSVKTWLNVHFNKVATQNVVHSIIYVALFIMYG